MPLTGGHGRGSGILAGGGTLGERWAELKPKNEEVSLQNIGLEVPPVYSVNLTSAPFLGGSAKKRSPYVRISSKSDHLRLSRTVARQLKHVVSSVDDEIAISISRNLADRYACTRSQPFQSEIVENGDRNLVINRRYHVPLSACYGSGEPKMVQLRRNTSKLCYIWT